SKPPAKFAQKDQAGPGGDSGRADLDKNDQVGRDPQTGAYNGPGLTAVNTEMNRDGMTIPAKRIDLRKVANPVETDKDNGIRGEDWYKASVEDDSDNDTSYTLRPVNWAVRPTRKRSSSVGSAPMTAQELAERVRLIQKGREQVQKTRENADAVEKSINHLEKNTPVPDASEDRERDRIPPVETKGKGVDPRNWGDANLSEGEMSEGEQELRYAQVQSLNEDNQRLKKAQDNEETHQTRGPIDNYQHRNPKTTYEPVVDEAHIGKRGEVKGSGNRYGEDARNELLELKAEIRNLHEKLMKKKLDKPKREKSDQRERSSAEPMSMKMNDLIDRAASQGPVPRKNPMSSSERMEKHTFIGK
ncbi:hypothetical protein H0H93_013429, partial [Arthromyces matolae]